VAPPTPDPLERLGQVPAQQFAPLLAHEHPQTIALILSQLEPAKAAAILHHLPEDLQAEVVYRIATMEDIPRSTLDRLTESLEMALRDVMGGNEEVGGPKVMAGILNRAGTGAERKMLEQLQAQNPQVAELVRNLMFGFGDLVRMSDRDIQVLLREVDQKDLVLALKGAGKELTERILANMSEQVRIFITEEMGFIGSVRQSEVDETRLRIVHTVRQLEERGLVTIARSTEDRLV
jgi:flagellar motor switch protein FliG